MYQKTNQEVGIIKKLIIIMGKSYSNYRICEIDQQNHCGAEIAPYKFKGSVRYPEKCSHFKA